MLHSKLHVDEPEVNKSKRKSSESWKQLTPSRCAHAQPDSTQEPEACTTDDPGCTTLDRKSVV